ncbi:hypothetical protein RND81_02G203000 [Saponaria officinalis]|uniref:Nuclear matrix constituent protein 1-like protein n=2 Tax=Saponaria officinalis TaxID=3572 RepID=A0AAW1MUZ0_SAPOF
MFTPQRKAPWTPQSSAPRTTAGAGGGASRLTAAEKGKSLAFVDNEPLSPPPPRSSFKSEIVRRGENSDDWKRFKEAGLLDQSSLERLDKEALANKVSKLETELFNYQHNMGLLIIDYENLVSNTEELGQEFAEAQEILKREKAANLIAISEAEQREENLKKALGAEKKCLAELERALFDMHEELTTLKASSATSVSDVNTCMETLEKKRLDIESKNRAADAKLATAERKNSELDRKLQDLEARKRILQRERLSLAEEKKDHQTYFQKHKSDLVEWEKKLHEGEQKLCENRRILKEREEKLHEIDRTSKEKEAYIDELQQKIDSADATLKKMKLDMEIKLADLISKEKKAETLRCKLDMTERELLEKEERLKARESVELENLLKKHKTELDAKMQEFELETKKRRNAMEEELSTRMQEIDARRSEINHREEMLGKREQALEKKSERVKEKEKDIDGTIAALKEREKSVKAEEKSLELEKKQINADKEGLEDLKKELETWRINLRKQEHLIEQEQKELEVLQEERSNYLRLQTNLKQEIEIARRQSELIEKEAGDLKLEREKFEKDWEALDEKRADVSSKLKMLAEERASFQKSQNSEEERLKRERAEIEENLRLESEKIRLEKESFEAAMQHQKKMYNENAEGEHSLLVHDLERERQEFLRDVKRRQKEWDEMMEEKERAFEERKLKEMGNLSHLKEDAEREMKDMKTERYRLEKEREEMELIKKQLEKTRTEMSTDVKALDDLSKTMKKQREEFASERQLFFAFIEQIKGCKNCGDSAQTFLRRDLEESLHFPRPSHHSEANDTLTEVSARTSVSPNAINRNNLKSGGQMSVLRKCASIIFKSPKDGSQPTDTSGKSPISAAPSTATKNGFNNIDYGSDERKLRTQNSAADGHGQSFRIVNDSPNNSRLDVSVREDSINTAPSVDVSNIASVEQSVQESEDTVSKTSRRKPGRKRGGGVRRTYSVKAVIEDAKAIVSEGSPGKMEVQPNNFAGAEASNYEDSMEGEIKPPGGRKRSRLQASRVTESEQEVEHSEGIADSATTGGRRKRRQTGAAAALQTPGQRRYNLRRHTAVETATPAQASSMEPKNEDDTASKDTEQTVQNPHDTPGPSFNAAVDSGSRLNLVRISTTKSIEISSDRIVKFSAADMANNRIDAAKSLHSASLREAKSGENKLISEEVNENKDDPIDDERVGDGGVDEGEDTDEEDGDDSDGHPGQASMGKKLWNFFTT